jgi:PhnB protein
MPSITPYLTLVDVKKAIAFYKKVFGAKVTLELPLPNGKICHAHITINGSEIMLCMEDPQWNQSPKTLKGTTVRLCLVVKDVDAMLKKAKKAGAKITVPAEDQFYGHRSGSIRDPFGHEWMFNQVIEDVSYPEMKRRFKKMISK